MPNKEGISTEGNDEVDELRKLFAVVSEGKRVWEDTFDAILDPVLVVSKEYRIERANVAAAQSSGRNVQELIGQHCYSIFAKLHAPCPSCPLAVSLGETLPKRQRLRAFPDGRTFLATAFPIHGRRAKKLDHAVVQYQDARALQKLEDQLLQNEKMAALGVLVGGIAHDINNPLAGVLAFAQLAMQGVESGGQTHQDLKEIETSALRCKKILEDLMEMARPKALTERSEVDLGRLVEKVLPSLLVQYQELDHRLDLRLKALTPVEVSASKLEQVFANILTNAFQALRAGGNIRIETQEDESSVAVEIQDDGEGIAEENLKNIFDPYFTTKRQRGGHGLGLPICYNIVREHGGHIEVTSRTGEGSLFRICLPKGGKE